MAKEKNSASRQDGVEYRRAKKWQLATSQAFSAASMCFYVLMSYATYIGNSNYGILVAVTGIIVTASRIFDGITDPICAYVIERFESPRGKIRIFLMAGWAVMALATTAMCSWGAGRLSGGAGLTFFIVCYGVYIIGYTLQAIAGSMVGAVITNDPKQRPILGVWSTVYAYLAPTLLSILGMSVLLPKFDDKIETPFLKAYNLVLISIALILYLITCIGVAEYDKEEYFRNVTAAGDKDSKPSLRDMLSLIRDNKEMQRYIWAGVSDKLTQTVGGAAVVTTMLNGILIGNLSIATILSAVAMVPSIIFVTVGARLAGKQGSKKVMVDWTWACIAVNVLLAVFLFFSDTTKITAAILPSVIYVALYLINGGVKMIVSMATNVFRLDIIDYELYRSGKYLPATVSAAYSFIDKLVSSLGTTIATFMIALVGYTTTTPQQGDPLTTGVKLMTVVLYCGFPIIGWIVTLIAMKNSELTREKMVEVQKTIADKKAAAKAAAAS